VLAALPATPLVWSLAVGGNDDDVGYDGDGNWDRGDDLGLFSPSRPYRCTRGHRRSARSCTCGCACAAHHAARSPVHGPPRGQQIHRHRQVPARYGWMGVARSPPMLTHLRVDTIDARARRRTIYAADASEDTAVAACSSADAATTAATRAAA